MSKSKKDTPNKPMEVSEPLFSYSSITKSSLEELEQRNRLYSISLTPIQRLAYLMDLNSNAYGKKWLLLTHIEKVIYRK